MVRFLRISPGFSVYCARPVLKSLKSSLVMLVQESQCAANVTEFGSQHVNVALSVVQGLVTFLSIVGSVLLILSYVLFRPLRSKSRLLITHLAVANFIDALPYFLAVFMDFGKRFKISKLIDTGGGSATKQKSPPDFEIFRFQVRFQDFKWDFKIKI